MSANLEVERSGMDTAKLALAVIVLVAGIGGFYYLEDQHTLLRVLGLLAVAGLAVFIAMQTAMGRALWSFAAEARTEVRKVVWPSRQEAVQTTLIVFVVVLLMSIFLWLVDMGLFAIVKAVTGQGA